MNQRKSISFKDVRESLAGIVRLFLQNPTRDLKILFTGHRGSGKTTELNRLAEKLRDHFLVMHFDIEGKLDPHSLTYLEILLYMGLSAYFTAKEEKIHLEKDTLNKLYESLYSIFYKVVKQKTFQGTIGAKLDALIFKLQGMLKMGTSREITRQLEIEPRASDLLDALNHMLDQIRELSGKEVCVLIDGLDKVSFSIGKELFERSAILVQVHGKVIYTIPLSLAFSSEFPQIKRYYDGRRTMPNIKVRNRDGTPDDEGRTFLRTVLSKRMRERLLTPEAVNLLIDGSGGVLRDLIEFAQNACSEALARDNTIIEEKDVKRTPERFPARLSSHPPSSPISSLTES